MSMRPEVYLRAVQVAEGAGKSVTWWIERVVQEACDAEGVPRMTREEARDVLANTRSKHRPFRIRREDYEGGGLDIVNGVRS